MVPAVKMYSIEINLLVDTLSSGSEALVYGTLRDVCVCVYGVGEQGVYMGQLGI